MTKERLKKQIDFLIEIDKIKSIFRNNYLADGSRKENDAEHSWHLSIMVLLLSEYMGNEDFDIPKTVKMVLIHDLVEIYAGDVYCYDETANEGKFEREKDAAEKLFSRLPDDQRDEFMKLWMEFEDRKTGEACFAAMVDRLQPLILNYSSAGKSWLEHGISSSKVIQRNSIFDEGPDQLREYVFDIINDAVDKGFMLR